MNKPEPVADRDQLVVKLGTLAVHVARYREAVNNGDCDVERKREALTQARDDLERFLRLHSNASWWSAKLHDSVYEALYELSVCLIGSALIPPPPGLASDLVVAARAARWAATSDGDGRKSSPPTEPLTDEQRAVFDLLGELPPSEALQGDEIVRRLNERGVWIGTSSLTSHIIPALRRKGIPVRNARRVGYYIAR